MPKKVTTLEKELRDLEYKLEHYEFHRRTAPHNLPSEADLTRRIAKTKEDIEKAKKREAAADAKRPYKHMPNEQDGGRRTRRRKSRKAGKTRKH